MKTLKLSIVGIALMAYSCSVQKTMKFAANPVVAHRGAFKANQLPQNSIAGLRKAIEMKLTGSEFDIWMTADDSIVINHDPDHGKMDIEKTSYAELNKVKLKNGEDLPLLRNYLLEGMRNNRQTQLVLEIKTSRVSKERSLLLTKKVLDLVAALKADAYAAYIAFDFDVIKLIARERPKAVTQYLNGDKSPAELKAVAVKGLDYHFSVYKKHPEWIREAKSLGLLLNAWTVNTKEDMDWLLKEKFNLITTDEPELLLDRITLQK